MPDTARDQLLRLLHILPAAIREGGVSIDALADDLGVARGRILRDVETLTERAFYHPAGTGDDLQIAIESDRLTIWSSGAFKRPVRLTALEALCLALGLRGLAPAHRRANLLERIERCLAKTGEADLRRRLDAPDLGPDPAGIRSAVSEALRRRAPCRFGYLKDGADAPEVRALETWALVHAEGHWYAVGRDPEADAPRAFRLDRVLGLEIRQGAYEIPTDVDPAAFVEGGRLFFRADPERYSHALVRYSPSVARWIRERWDGTPDDDGGWCVRHPLGDPGWVVRHVLQYGTDAELIEPVELREVVRSTADRMARDALSSGDASSA